LRFFALVLCVGFLAGCNPFDTREAEAPETTTEWISYPIRATEVEQNLISAYTYRQDLSRYNELFASDFRFIPEPQDINEFDLPSTWNRDFEYHALAGLWNLVPSGQSISIDLIDDPDRTDELLATSAKLYRLYELTIPTSSGTLHANGRFYLYLENRDGLWSIIRWYDYRTSSQPTWGKRKYDAAP
jgi:hypothetical protein